MSSSKRITKRHWYREIESNGITAGHFPRADGVFLFKNCDGKFLMQVSLNFKKPADYDSKLIKTIETVDFIKSRVIQE
jgi:hypothetical protein